MQKTIRRRVCCSGLTINGGLYTTITFYPAAPDTGIVFVREDLPGQPEVPCRPEYARVDARWTSLQKDNVRIEHTEHLLAAIAGLGLDNIKIVLNSPDIPVVSNFSSSAFVEALLKAQPIAQKKPKVPVILQKPLCVSGSFYYEEKRYERAMLALPSPHLIITYLLDYPAQELPTQFAHFIFDDSLDFAAELANARSFILQREYETVVKLIGNSMKDCLVISGEPALLKWQNEPARHKVLDLLGDLCTLGTGIKGHFIGIRTGHKDNIQMCQKIHGQIKEAKP